MRKLKRREHYDMAPVNEDHICNDNIDIGLVAMKSSNDPEPELEVKDGQIVRMDGRSEDEFDSIDKFIVKYGIDINVCEEAMAMSSVDIAKMMVDINVPRREVIRIANGLTPAKILDVVSHMNAVEIMMAQMKLRARKETANQAHAVNVLDNPVLMAADAAEAACRGFAELETTSMISRMGPMDALAVLVGSQTGRPGVITQCSLEESTELKIGMKGFTSYAETVSVYGTEEVMTDGDDTPWSKAFLTSAYASRGMKMRFSSGTGAEIMMGYAEAKSMLYLEIRCIWLAKACGSQGIQNGSIDGLPISSAAPGGIRAVAAENMITSMLGVEVAAGNDAQYSHSFARTMSKMMLALLPGADLITSGYGAVPNFDNTFTGVAFDSNNYPDFYMMQRDMMADGGIFPIEDKDAIRVRTRAAKAMQALFNELGFPEITDEEVEEAIYAYSSRDMPKRNLSEDMAASVKMLEGDFNAFDVVRALHKAGYDDVAKSIFNLLKQRVAGDYLHTAAIFDKDFNVVSAINNENDYMGPGSGYRMSEERWSKLSSNDRALDYKDYLKPAAKPENMTVEEIGQAKKGTDSTEVIVALSPTFADHQITTIMDIPHYRVLREIAAGIEEEGMKARFIKCHHTSDLAAFASYSSKLSGSGIAIGIQSKGTTVITQKDLPQLENLELFPLAPLYDEEIYRHIGRNAAKYAKGESPEPIVVISDLETPFFLLPAIMLHNQETQIVEKDRSASDLRITINPDNEEERYVL